MLAPSQSRYTFGRKYHSSDRFVSRNTGLILSWSSDGLCALDCENALLLTVTYYRVTSTALITVTQSAMPDDTQVTTL